MGLYIVTGDTVPLHVHTPETVLGLAYRRLLGGLTVPLYGLPIVLRHAPPILIHTGEENLGSLMPLLSGFAVPPHGLPIVTRRALAFLIHTAEEGLSRSITLDGQG